MAKILKGNVPGTLLKSIDKDTFDFWTVVVPCFYCGGETRLFRGTTGHEMTAGQSMNLHGEADFQCEKCNKLFSTIINNDGIFFSGDLNLPPYRMPLV